MGLACISFPCENAFYCESLVDMTVLCFFALFMFSLCSAAVGKRRCVFEGVLMLYVPLNKEMSHV